MKKVKNKKIIFILILLLVISSTVAYLYSSDTFQNIFVAASYKVRVVETFESPDNWKPGDTTPKTATLKNEGTVPIKVRVKLEEVWKDSNNQDLPLQHNEENVAIINFANEDDYIYRNGYYYYDLALNPGETTSSIIESVTFNPNYSGTVTCVENNDSTHTCSSSESGYEGGTYKLTLTIEGIQEDYYVQAWGLPGIVQQQYLYDVLKNEAESGGPARKYTGEHHDSFTEEPSKDIYHWYADNSTNGNIVLDKNNVIFGDHCWQMLRTTDTGGVKMIYNGEVEDGKCLSNRAKHEGYKSNNTAHNLNPNYWYGTDYIYDRNTKLFTLSGNITMGEPRIGEFTCESTTQDGTCSTLYLIEELSPTHFMASTLVSTSPYSQFGASGFSSDKNSLAYSGYMYNKVYPYRERALYLSETIFSSTTLDTSYWYSDSIDYGIINSNKYTLVNPYQVNDASEYNSLVGKYTFRNSTDTYSNTSVYYIAGVSGSTMYYIQLQGGHNLDYYNYSFTCGSSYTDNGNGTYTIINPTVVERKDWFTNYCSYRSYICKNANNATCSELRYTSSSSRIKIEYLSTSRNYKYANSFIWDGSKYILNTNNDVQIWNFKDNLEVEKLNNAHYTCFNSTGECTKLYYVYYYSNLGVIGQYYIELEDGKSIEDAIDEMLYNDDVNAIDSKIKKVVDFWFEKYMINYSDYLEDTIFCNDRSIINKQENGWNPNGGDLKTYLDFKNYNIETDLSCSNITDQFSISNNKAKLTYKVGLFSAPEMNLLNSRVIRGSSHYWLLSPYVYLSYELQGIYVGSGDISSGQTTYSYPGIRPAISLKPGIEYSSGDGSMANPYIVDTD